MNINFDKTDRLIQIIDEAVRVLDSAEYNLNRASKLQNSPNKKLNKLHDDLVKITSDPQIPEKDKKQKKIRAYSIAYECDETSALLLFEHDCNFQDFAKWICKTYWEIQPYITFSSKGKNNIEDWIKYLEKYRKNEIYLDIMANVIINKEPSVKDIECEFWTNCTDVFSINNFCNIYRERWRNHLYHIKESDFEIDAMLFDGDNRLHKCFLELLKCGFISEEEKDYILTHLYHLADATNYVCGSIVDLFKKLRASSIETAKESESATEQASQPIGTKSSKVQLATIMEILKAINVDKSNTDLTKIIRIAAFITGKSYKKLYKDANNRITFDKSFHKNEIDEINKLFQDANLDISIDINKEY